MFAIRNSQVFSVLVNQGFQIMGSGKKDFKCRSWCSHGCDCCGGPALQCPNCQGPARNVTFLNPPVGMSKNKARVLVRSAMMKVSDGNLAKQFGM